MLKRYGVAVALALLVSSSAGADGKKLDGSSSFATSDRTNIDFSDTLIDGKMQAPSGFFLQGRQAHQCAWLVQSARIASIS